MNHLRGFVPWIAFAVVSAAGWQWGALTGLVLALWLLVRDRRAGVAADALILESSTAGCFALLTAVAFAAPHSGLHHWTGALSMGWLALTAWATLAVRRPFTLGIARRQAPREVWESPVFVRVGVVLTTVWAAAFTLTAALLGAISATRLGQGASIPVQVAGFVLPALFTARYPDRVRARLTAAAA
ncbi:hypothetical protein V2S66_25380 [Streptomyces sp. V4-01]|uniref:DUF3159 domain-containing protein n=1 Tax=Actinacidiphila polyblastidii TaxID=3110430 RepID=A0ABU7PHK2_9ACTN|nr:hypothetical protein [Streptomyces sp. V4-01]